MKKLKQTIEVKGIDEPMNSTQVKRKGNICMYLRDDGAYEVFIVKIQKAKVIKDVVFEQREVYPKNEDFGVTAWCFWKNEVRANMKFQELVEQKS